MTDDVVRRDGQVLVAWRDELSVVAEASAPLIAFFHDYGDRKLLLDVREARIDARIDNDPAAGARRVEWRTVKFLPANRAILNALKLPHEYAITPAPAVGRATRDAQGA